MCSSQDEELDRGERMLAAENPTWIEYEDWPSFLLETYSDPSTPEPGPLDIQREVRIETPSSVWLIQPDRYMRMPKTETSRMTLNMIGAPGLADLVWHQHIGPFVIADVWGPRVQLMRPLASPGRRWVMTGEIVTFTTR